MCAASRNATSSPASAAGRTPSSSPSGETDLFGQAHVLVSRSARRGSKKPTMTSGISGPRGFGSSASAALSESLASRLQVALGSAGSMLFRQTWKRKHTPLGRSYWAHTASAHRISGNGCGSWPTPVADDDNKSVKAHQRMKERMGGGRTAITSLQVMVQMASWPTPKVATGAYQYSSGDHNKKVLNLEGAAKLAVDLGNANVQDVASWPTPMAGTPAQKGYNEAGNTDSGRKTVALASGMAGLGFLVATAKRGPFQLNPRFSLWLQGYPIAWAHCAERVIQSTRGRRQPS